jgi:ABC-type branched-subunit amino acid transport system substrate-binding protein
MLDVLLMRSCLLAIALPCLCGCSLGNISVEECNEDSQCEDAFGLGSSCEDGYCTDGVECLTGHDCRTALGGGACVAGRCADVAPPDPLGACTLTEPPNILDRALVRGTPPLTLVGGMFRLGDTADPPMAQGAILAVREILDVSGLNDGRGIGIVICDDGGEGNGLTGQARQDRIQGVTDYLAGTLGAPFIVGPTTSTDALDTINYVLARGYPTMLISPSATSPALTAEPDRLNPAEPYGLFWRTAPSDQLQGVVLAQDVVGAYPNDPGPPPTVNRVAVVYLNDAYGEGLANVFQEQWLAGGNSAQLFPFADSESINWGTIANDVAVFAPEAVMMVALDADHAVAFIAEMAARPSLATAPLYLTDGSKDAVKLLSAELPAEVQAIVYSNVFGTAPAGPDPMSAEFNLFKANYEGAFAEDPTGFAFVANAYDAAYVGAAGLVWAAQGGLGYDGRQLAEGMTRLIAGTAVPVGKTTWSAMKSGLTTGDKQIDFVGISGNLDFDPAIGEAGAPIEVWQPTNLAANCSGAPPCFRQVARIE